MTTLAEIGRTLAGHRPLIIPPSARTLAAVALVLRQVEAGVEALFIERATRDDDPWSGDIGLPGGKVETGDGTPKQTAERETLEEIGLDLSAATCLGRLSDIAGAHLPVLVSCYVYRAEKVPPLTASHEVREIFWVSIADLNSEERHVTTEVRFGGETFQRPAILLPLEGKPPLWGITYRFIREFLQLCRGSSGEATYLFP